MKPRYFIFTLALASLVACGRSSSPGASSSPTTTAEPSAPKRDPIAEQRKQDSIDQAFILAQKLHWDTIKDEVLSRMERTTDDFEGITFYTPKSAIKSTYEPTLHLYVGQRPKGQPWLRLRCRYGGSKWLFVDDATIKYDGRKYTFHPGPDGWKRDNTSHVWEHFDKSPSFTEVSIMDAIANSDAAVLRFRGSKGIKDHTISDKDKQGILDAIALYKGLGGTMEALMTN